MEDNAELLVLGLVSGLAVGGLAALLARKRRHEAYRPDFERGLELRGRPEGALRRGASVASEAVSRARRAL